ncbi:nuclear transport factor 2 family protein [Hymenobacter weizhouensis]|uniref:nuclear transport factor 2 family protein n=1 Tax=Hymenobacter sp. YIM 151500-1 TaxID=2987689 RepID=UPI0022264CC5|nr:hypothetical protein [Hymenobacter sp. YIM 151500-1]UYZ64484.1 hypothetical protein OIS53_06445 [Hymenobacter sp. YIM 151500-1]
MLSSPRKNRALLGSWCLSLLLASSCSKDSTPEPADREALRQSAIGFYQALYSSSATSVDSYVAAGYTEHQVSADFTLAGLQAYARRRAQAGPSPRLVVHRSLVQDNLVALHIEEKVAPDSSVARMALLRFDGSGKIVDHWEAMQGQPRRRANPNTMFDGAAVNPQSTAGPRHRAALVAADQRVFNQYDTLLVRQTRTPDYIQHNPGAPNGPGGLIFLLTLLKSQGIRTTATTHQQLAEGDFILTLNNYQTTPGFPGFTDVLAFDLTRVTEAGKAAEHWDVIEELRGADKSKVF